VNGLYQVRIEKPLPHANLAAEGPLLVTPQQLHVIMGHIPVEAAKKLVKNRLVGGVELDKMQPGSTDECKSCLHGRMTRKPISKGTDQEAAGEMGDDIHTDVWGPAPVKTTQHKRYYVSFTDEVTCYTAIVLLHLKDKTFEATKDFILRWETEYGVTINILHSDRGGEYKSHEFNAYLAGRGIQHRFTAHDTPEHNGVAEPLNRTLKEKVRAMLHAVDLPDNLWGEALKHAVWLKN
jgi:hypothetical protein